MCKKNRWFTAIKLRPFKVPGSTATMLSKEMACRYCYSDLNIMLNQGWQYKLFQLKQRFLK